MDYFLQDKSSIFINVHEIPINPLAFVFSCLITILFLIVLFEKSLVLAKFIINFLSVFYLKLLAYLLYGKIVLNDFWFLTFEKRSSLEEKLNVFSSIKDNLFAIKKNINISFKDVPEEILNINNIDTFSAKLNLFLSDIALTIPDEIITKINDSTWIYYAIGLSVITIIIVGIIVYNGSNVEDPSNIVGTADIAKLNARLDELEKTNVKLNDTLETLNQNLEEKVSYALEYRATSFRFGSLIIAHEFDLSKRLELLKESYPRLAEAAMANKKAIEDLAKDFYDS